MRLFSVVVAVALWWTLILASVWGAWAEAQRSESLICLNCGAPLEIVPPEPDVVVAPVLTPLACPVCGSTVLEVGSTGYSLRVVAEEEPLIPEGCYHPPPPYGCHGGSPKHIWDYHTRDMRAVQKLRIAEGDCLRCHHSREDLWPLYEKHYKSWYWYEREKAKQAEQEQSWTFRLPEPHPMVLVGLAGWALVTGVAWLMRR